MVRVDESHDQVMQEENTGQLPPNSPSTIRAHETYTATISDAAIPLCMAKGGMVISAESEGLEMKCVDDLKLSPLKMGTKGASNASNFLTDQQQNTKNILTVTRSDKSGNSGSDSSATSSVATMITSVGLAANETSNKTTAASEKCLSTCEADNFTVTDSETVDVSATAAEVSYTPVAAADNVLVERFDGLTAAEAAKDKKTIGQGSSLNSEPALPCTAIISSVELNSAFLDEASTTIVAGGSPVINQIPSESAYRTYNDTYCPSVAAEEIILQAADYQSLASREVITSSSAQPLPSSSQMSMSGVDVKREVRTPLIEPLSRLGMLSGFMAQDEELTSLAWLQDANLLKNITRDPPQRSTTMVEEKENVTMTSDMYQPITAQHTFSKPPYSFSCLIFMAIDSSRDKQLPVKDIYRWITDRYPYFRRAHGGWRNSVRHNLSLNKCFRKVDKIEEVGKGSSWCIAPGYRQNMLQSLKRSPYHPYHQHQISCNNTDTVRGAPLAQLWENSFYEDIDDVKSEEIKIEIDDDLPSLKNSHCKKLIKASSLTRTSAEDLDVANTLAELSKFIHSSGSSSSQEHSLSNASDDTTKMDITSTPPPSEDHSYTNPLSASRNNKTSLTNTEQSALIEPLNSRRFLRTGNHCTAVRPQRVRKRRVSNNNKELRIRKSLISEPKPQHSRTSRNNKKNKAMENKAVESDFDISMQCQLSGTSKNDRKKEAMENKAVNISNQRCVGEVVIRALNDEEKELRDGVDALLNLANLCRTSASQLLYDSRKKSGKQGKSLPSRQEAAGGTLKKFNTMGRKRGRPAKTLSQELPVRRKYLKHRRSESESNGNDKRSINKKSLKTSARRF